MSIAAREADRDHENGNSMASKITTRFYSPSQPGLILRLAGNLYFGAAAGCTLERSSFTLCG